MYKHLTSFLGNSAQRIELGSNIWNMTSGTFRENHNFKEIKEIPWTSWTLKPKVRRDRKGQEEWKQLKKTRGSQTLSTRGLFCWAGIPARAVIILGRMPQIAPDNYRAISWNLTDEERGTPLRPTHIRCQHVLHSSAFHRYWNSLQMCIDMRTWAVRIHKRVRCTAIII